MGSLLVFEGSALHKSMSWLSTEHTKIVVGIVHSDVASEGRAAIPSMPNFHAISANDWSIPDAGGCGMSMTSARLAVEGC
jgi:hypothetical protein